MAASDQRTTCNSEPLELEATHFSLLSRNEKCEKDFWYEIIKSESNLVGPKQTLYHTSFKNNYTDKISLIFLLSIQT